MNIRFLKFSVIFMGILIILGIIILFISIYKKINYIESGNDSKEKYFYEIKKPKGMKFLSYSINGDRIIIRYENNDNIKLFIVDYIKEKVMKKIDILK